MSVDTARVDRSAYRIDDLDETAADREYWLAKSPQVRMEALELMRQISYG